MNKEERDLNFGKLFHMYWVKSWIILLCGVICAMILGGYTQVKSHQPYTEIKNNIMIVNSATPNTQGIYETQNSIQNKIFENFIQTETFLEEIKNSLQGVFDIKELKQMISSEYDAETGAFTITIKYPDREKAMAVSNQMIRVSKDYMEKNLEITSFDFFVLETKETLVKPTSKTKEAAIIGAAVGIFLSAIVLFVLFITNQKINDEDDVDYYLDLPCLGEIQLKNPANVPFVVSQLLLQRPSAQTISVCSFYHKSFDIVHSLAISLNQKDKKVLIVIPNETEDKGNKQPLKSNLGDQIWEMGHVSFDTMDDIRKDFDYILFDLTEPCSLDQKLEISSKTDLCLLAIKQDSEKYAFLSNMQKKFKDCGVQFAGVILYR